MTAQTLRMRRLDIAQLGNTVVFFAPHDDDAAIGCGLLMSALRQRRIAMRVIVMTDGSLGYVRAKERNRIARIRKNEAMRCYRTLGAQKTVFWDFPDACLEQYRCWKTPNGKIGAYQKLSRDLRRIRPSSVFLPNPADIHPDHRAAFRIWEEWGWQAARPSFPDMGRALKRMPRVFVYRIRTPLRGAPLIHTGNSAAISRKRNALKQFSSQAAILKDIPIQKSRELYRRIA